MTGDIESGGLEARGLNYRALDDLFRLAGERTGAVRYSLSAQMLEIYNESIRDLLLSERDPREREREGGLDILSTQPSGRNVPAAKQVGDSAAQCSAVGRRAAPAQTGCARGRTRVAAGPSPPRRPPPCARRCA
jgi:hypothetical protein